MVKKKEVQKVAAILGSRGGKKSASNMSPEERSKRARLAASQRWKANEEEKKK